MEIKILRKYRNEVKMEEEYESSSEGEVEDLPTMMRKMRLALKEEKARSAKLEAKIEKLEKNIQDLEYGSCACEIECDKLVDDCYKLNYECDDLNERLSALVESIWPRVEALEKKIGDIDVDQQVMEGEYMFEVNFSDTMLKNIYRRLVVLEKKFGIENKIPKVACEWINEE